METLMSILGFVIVLITFFVKHWVDMKEAKKAVEKTVEKWKAIKEDGKITDKEKQEFADRAMKTLEVVIPVLTSIWKFNWKKKRDLNELLK
jgi:hypothetical protein